MQTNNLKDLKSLKGTTLPVFSSKPGNYVSVEYTEAEMVGKTIAGLFIRTLRYNQGQIRSTCMKVYGKPVDVKGHTAELLMKLKNVTNLTYDIRRYLGYKVSFLDRRGQPIDPERIEQAHKEVKQNKSLVQVENALYF